MLHRTCEVEDMLSKISGKDVNEPMKNVQDPMDRKTVTASKRIHLTENRHVVVQRWGTQFYVCIRDFYQPEKAVTLNQLGRVSIFQSVNGMKCYNEPVKLKTCYVKLMAKMTVV
ncbi:uncharacterized protein LOC117116430 [Anneissia japonica]|uniref:uncharacterized protein LOC117116430 n=1 Tax=Anneissia japonica TaxID=1529436 RepID=UPI0014255654|nr:uncharacterized protein LOC117116430 [Anneissia japonica]